MPTTLFQIWIEPDERRRRAVLGRQAVPEGRPRPGEFVALASGFAGDADALPIRADARVLGATLKAGETAEYALGAGTPRLSGAGGRRVEVNGVRLEARDGAAISDEKVVKVKALSDSEIVLVDTV